MGSRVSSSIVRALCLILLPSLCAGFCTAYWDKNGGYHPAEFCGSYCCGDCGYKYCCSFSWNEFDIVQQTLCSGRFVSHGGTTRHGGTTWPVVVGAVVAAIIPVVICVCLIICCVAPCCMCHKWRKRRNQRHQRHQNVRHTSTVVNTPAQHQPPPSGGAMGLQPSYPYPGYQPVPLQPGYGGRHVPTAPLPSYEEATDPAYPPAAFSLGQQTYPHPGQPYKPPRQPEELTQPPFNPSYCSQP